MPASKDVYGQFYNHAQLDGQHFADTNQKRFDDVVMVEIFIKGSTKASISKKVFDKNNDPIVLNMEGETYLDWFPKAYKAFIREAGTEVDGTPLRNLAGIGPGQIMNLQAMGINTVEDIAELNDSVVVGEPGMLDLRKKAQAYFAVMNPEIAEKEKALQEAEQERKDEEIRAMREEVQQMKTALANATIIESTKKPRKRRKRNPETGQLE